MAGFALHYFTMKTKIINHRGPLARTRAAIDKGFLTIGFIGGSVTDPRPPYTWPYTTTAWFQQMFPGLQIQVENAAIGGTGSDYAIFRAKEHLIDRGCDLVFVEYAANDYKFATSYRMPVREGLLRKLLAAGSDVVLTYIFHQEQYADMIANRVPSTIVEFEQLADRYNLGSVWMGLNALREVQAGGMRWEEWMPDTMHPESRGSYSYAEPVKEYLKAELLKRKPAAKKPAGKKAAIALPAPLTADNWEHAELLDLHKVKTQGPWTLRRYVTNIGMDLVLETFAPGAKMSFEFKGKTLCLCTEFGKLASEYRWRIDGGQWTTTQRERPEWPGPTGFYNMIECLAQNLPAGRHTVDIEVIHGNGPGCNGCTFRLGQIGIVP